MKGCSSIWFTAGRPSSRATDQTLLISAPYTQVLPRCSATAVGPSPTRPAPGDRWWRYRTARLRRPPTPSRRRACWAKRRRRTECRPVRTRVLRRRVRGLRKHRHDRARDQVPVGVQRHRIDRLDVEQMLGTPSGPVSKFMLYWNGRLIMFAIGFCAACAEACDVFLLRRGRHDRRESDGERRQQPGCSPWTIHLRFPSKLFGAAEKA